MKKNNLSRRQLIKNTATVTFGSALYFSSPLSILGSSGSSKKTKVILIRDENVLDDAGKCHASTVANMLDTSVCLLTGKEAPLDAWGTLIKSNDVVGIKSNEWGPLPTPPELEQAIQKRVMDMGVPGDKISIKDRAVLSDQVFQNSTALINARPLRTHAWSGVGSLIKNYIMFTKRPASYHGDSCADLAAIWKYPITKDKTRLNILVMFTPLFHGTGPHHFNRQYTWTYKGLIVGFDPVAVDAVGIKILQNKRHEYFGEDRPINPPPKHIELADTRHNLGTADFSKIELIQVGVKENSLI